MAQLPSKVRPWMRPHRHQHERDPDNRHIRNQGEMAMTARLQASGVDAGYHGHPVVSDFNLELHPGQVSVLLGPNGAGKATTLLTLAGELPTLAGEVRMNGEIGAVGLHRRARRGL